LSVTLAGLAVAHDFFRGPMARDHPRLREQATAENQQRQSEHGEALARDNPQRDRRDMAGAGEEQQIGAQDGDAVEGGGGDDGHTDVKIGLFDDKIIVAGRARRRSRGSPHTIRHSHFFDHGYQEDLMLSGTSGGPSCGATAVPCT